MVKIKELVKPSGALGVIGGVGTIVGVILGISSLIDLYNNKSIDNLTGEWLMINQIKDSSLKRYVGLELGYKVYIQQDGNKIDISGEKYLENGKSVKFENHTPINLQGQYDGKTLNLKMTEEGKIRNTTGMVILSRKGNNDFEGTFSSTAANSKGICLLTRSK